MASQTAPIDMALRFLAQRPRTEQEVRRRLLRAGTDEAAIEGVLERLRAHALVDDAAFAQYWVEQRQMFRPRGARLLRAELRHRGIDAAEAEAAFKTRLAQFLSRRGFDWDTISVAVNRLWDEVSMSS